MATDRPLKPEWLRDDRAMRSMAGIWAMAFLVVLLLLGLLPLWIGRS